MSTSNITNEALAVCNWIAKHKASGLDVVAASWNDSVALSDVTKKGARMGASSNQPKLIAFQPRLTAQQPRR